MQQIMVQVFFMGEALQVDDAKSNTDDAEGQETNASEAVDKKANRISHQMEQVCSAGRSQLSLHVRQRLLY